MRVEYRFWLKLGVRCPDAARWAPAMARLRGRVGGQVRTTPVRGGSDPAPGAWSWRRSARPEVPGPRLALCFPTESRNKFSARRADMCTSAATGLRSAGDSLPEAVFGTWRHVCPRAHASPRMSFRRHPGSLSWPGRDGVVRPQWYDRAHQTRFALAEPPSSARSRGAWARQCRTGSYPQARCLRMHAHANSELGTRVNPLRLHTKVLV